MVAKLTERINEPPLEANTYQFRPGGDVTVLTDTVAIDPISLGRVDFITVGETMSETIDRIGYVKTVPWFDELITDTSRVNTFTYKAISGTVGPKGFAMGSASAITLTEHEGLVGLYGFLSTSRNTLRAVGKREDRVLIDMAEDMLENFTFIGDKEMEEASAGMAEYWKTLLRENPDLQFCVLKEISSKMLAGKSDRYVLNKVLEHFDDTERDEFAGRVLLDLDKLTSDPQDTKVILLDDWSISGNQIRTSLGLVFRKLRQLGLAGSVEAHLIVASPTQIENGILTTSAEEIGEPLRLPVKSYFLAHKSTAAKKPAKSVISGVHSAVNYDFELPIHEIVRRLREIESEYSPGEPTTVMPPLTNIGREYR
ncbi:MAG: hypothetical protein U0451_03170 [Candidatus Saccharimonadales bacterium]